MSDEEISDSDLDIILDLPRRSNRIDISTPPGRLLSTDRFVGMSAEEKKKLMLTGLRFRIANLREDLVRIDAGRSYIEEQIQIVSESVERLEKELADEEVH